MIMKILSCVLLNSTCFLMHGTDGTNNIFEDFLFSRSFSYSLQGTKLLGSFINVCFLTYKSLSLFCAVLQVAFWYLCYRTL